MKLSVPLPSVSVEATEDVPPIVTEGIPTEDVAKDDAPVRPDAVGLGRGGRAGADPEERLPPPPLPFLRPAPWDVPAFCPVTDIPAKTLPSRTIGVMMDTDASWKVEQS